MTWVLDQVLLVAAGFALGAAALRLAAQAVPAGLERVLAAAPAAMAAAVIEALVLGAFGLAGSPVALALAALATWIVALLRLPAPATRTRLGTPGALALLGAAGGFAAWALYRPLLGYDGFTYHLSTVVTWVQSGDTGAVHRLIADLPVGNYPLTNEAGLAWAVGISHSFAPVAFWTAGLVLLLAASGWSGLRTLGVPAAVRAAAIVALCVTPLALRQIVQAESDFAALAWLACTAALGAAAQRRPLLLAPALLAAALAVGTKTTVAPLGAIVLVLAALPLRRAPGLARPLVAAAVAGLAAGGFWYLRDLVQHGSPLWPLVSAPWGDPVPPVIDRAGYSLLERPAATIHHGALTVYREEFAGALMIGLAALSAPLWARTRATVAGAAATAVALLAWASAPFTGRPHAAALGGVAFDTVRYALPLVGAAAVTLALAARRGPNAALAAGAVFAAAIGWSVERYAALPYLPSDGVLLLALAAGAALVAAAGPRLGLPRLAGAAAVVAMLALGAHGYVARHARVGEIDSALLGRLASEPAWSKGHAAVAASPVVLATPAGDRLRSRLSLVGEREPCTRVAGRIASGYLVLSPMPRDLYRPQSVSRCIAAGRPRFVAGPYRVYGPLRR